jgi:hypothetical protein
MYTQSFRTREFFAGMTKKAGANATPNLVAGPCGGGTNKIRERREHTPLSEGRLGVGLFLP